MKKTICILVAVILCIGAVLLSGQVADNEKETKIFRLHIRANSNADIDQNVKYEIKEAFVSFLTPYVAECKSKEDAMEMTKRVSHTLEQIADDILEKHNFDYKSNVKICNEYFPDRYYEGEIVESGYYDALICELGEAKGDNWWCVVYPPLCFVPHDNASKSLVVYKSKILEIIEKFFKQGD